MLRLFLQCGDHGRFVNTLDQMMEDIFVPLHYESVDIIRFPCLIIPYVIVILFVIISFSNNRCRTWFEQKKDNESLTYSVFEAIPDVNGGFDSPKEIGHCALRSIDLTESHRQELLQQIALAAESRLNANFSDIQQVSVDSDAAGKEGKNANSKKNRTAALAWASFVQWISCADRVPADIIVDGANVGYYKQNYAGAPKHIDYNQLNSIIQHLQSIGKRVLLVLHCRHLHPGTLPREFIPLTEQWKKDDILFVAPAGCNDGESSSILQTVETQ